MIGWFRAKAPIRLKMKVMSSVLGALMLIVAVSGLACSAGYLDAAKLLPITALAVSCFGLFAFLMSRAISEPYVATVVRMEKLAVGDLESPIEFTEFTDCVGRMTKAMYSFRQAAKARIEAEASAELARTQGQNERGERDREKARHADDIEAAISALADGLAKLADGNLSFRVESALVGDLDRLRNNFNASVEGLEAAMAAVGASGRGIRNGSKELNGAADELARRTEKQAASLEETAAAIATITTTVRKTAEGAMQARGVVATAKTDAETSGKVAQDAVEAMKGIAGSSRQIGQIIGVIDEIAFQTNLLALNAGVEAARAGEAGRGFAVVASEVRALAQRSAEAAKEIKTLISTSATHVDRGFDLVAETGKALDRIVVHVAQINDVVAEIATSAQEQSVGLQEINTAVSQMDQMTQQNAAMVEESTAASHAMTKEADALMGLLARFQVADGGSHRMEGSTSSAHKPSRAAAPRSAAPNYGGGASAARKLQVVQDPQSWEEF